MFLTKFGHKLLLSLSAQPDYNMHFRVLNYENQHKEGTCKFSGRYVVFSAFYADFCLCPKLVIITTLISFVGNKLFSSQKNNKKTIIKKSRRRLFHCNCIILTIHLHNVCTNTLVQRPSCLKMDTFLKHRGRFGRWGPS